MLPPVFNLLVRLTPFLFSKEVFDKLKNQPEYRSVSLGRFEFKNVDEPLEIFALANDGLVVPKKEQLSGKLKEIKKLSARRKLFITAAAFGLLIASWFVYKNIAAPPVLPGKSPSPSYLLIIQVQKKWRRM